LKTIVVNKESQPEIREDIKPKENSKEVETTIRRFIWEMHKKNQAMSRK